MRATWPACYFPGHLIFESGTARVDRMAASNMNGWLARVLLLVIPRRLRVFPGRGWR